MRIILLIALLLSACVTTPQKSETLLLQGDVVLSKDTIWQGKVLIDGQVTVARGVWLRLRPGTDVRFVRKDNDRDGLGDATIIVKGRLTARGTEKKPVRFASAQPDPAPGDWLEIRSDFARKLEFDWCEFRDSAYTLHAHFTQGYLRNSRIHHNIDGTRLGRSEFVIENNLIEHNSGKAVNFRDSAVTVRANIIRDNRVGIFLFQKPGSSDISQNNLYRNGRNLQVGDFFVADITLSDNWWGSSSLAQIQSSIHDQDDDPNIGKVLLTQAKRWNFSAGIQHSARLDPLWHVVSNGFVDASPVKIGDGVVFASWDGFLRLVDAAGKVQWRADVGDVVDADMGVSDKLYAQNWSRELFSVDPGTGQRTQLFVYPQSLADDHRQGGIVATKDFLLLPAWNGTLYALSIDSHQLLWKFAAGQPLRSTPLVRTGEIYITSGSGQVSALDFNGNLQWQFVLPKAFLVGPVGLDDGLLLLDKEGTLYRFDTTGSLVWKRDLKQKSFYAAPVVDAGDIFVATAAGELWKLDAATADVIWRRKLATSIYATPTLSAQQVFVGDNNGALHVIDRDSGRELETVQVGGAIQTRSLLTGNRLYFGSRDRNLYAFSLEQGASQ